MNHAMPHQKRGLAHHFAHPGRKASGVAASRPAGLITHIFARAGGQLRTPRQALQAVSA